MPGKAISDHEIRDHVTKIELSDRFDSVVRQRRILRFLTEETLAGRGDRLTEQFVAKELFSEERGVVAKVEISRLRSRLDQYYGTEGESDRLRVSIPKRKSIYKPEFLPWPPDVQEGPSLPEISVTRYITAPPLPVNYVARDQDLNSLRSLVVADGGNRHIALAALAGMGGIGKTVLAQALCSDVQVQRRFPDGIIWLSIGQESEGDIVGRMREIAKALSDPLVSYDTPQGSINQYRTSIQNKAALIILDDIWSASDLEPFRANSPRSRILFTTRDRRLVAAVGAQEYIVNLLTEQQSREVFAKCCNCVLLPTKADDLIRECGVFRWHSR